MRIRLVLFAAFVMIASHVIAQTPPRAPQAPQAPATPASPAPAASPLPPPPPPAAPHGPPQRPGQPINVKVELTIREEGGGPPVKKSVTAVIGDGFNGYVREQGMPIPGPNRSASLNLDAYPAILTNGKVRLTCSIQYVAGTAASQTDQNEPASSTDIRQNLVLILESGKSLVVSQATDPRTDRQVTVEVKATILR